MNIPALIRRSARNAAHSALSIALGFLGGIAAVKFPHYLNNDINPGDVGNVVVRATRFELVNSFGTPLAYWGNDPICGSEIAFVDRHGKPRARFGTSCFWDGEALEYDPFISFLDSRGQERLSETFSYRDNVSLAMADATGNKLTLGHSFFSDTGETRDPWNNWSLQFRDASSPNTRAAIGLTTPLDTNHRTGYLVLSNASRPFFTELPSSLAHHRK